MHQRMFGGVLGLAAGLVQVLGAQTAVAVHGRLTDTLKRPLAGIEVSAPSGGVLRVAVTNQEGVFRLLVLADGAVTLTARGIGYIPLTWAVTGPSDGMRTLRADTMLVATPIHLPDILQLPPERLVSRPRPGLVVGGAERPVRLDRLLTDRPASLEELLRQMDRMRITDSGPSLLGAPANQNSIVVDGLRAGSRDLPPDALGLVQFASTTVDATRGDGLGGALRVGTVSGTDQVRSVVRMHYADPRVAWVSRPSPWEPEARFDASGMVAGPLRSRSAYYLLTFAVDQQRVANPSLRSPASADRLAELGVLPDTVQALTAQLARVGLPIGGVERTTVLQHGAAFLKADWQPGPLTMASGPPGVVARAAERCSSIPRAG